MKAISQGHKSSQVITVTSHFSFRDLLTLKLGQGH